MNRAIGKNVSADSASTFAEDAAQKSGRSRRVIEEEVHIALNLDEKAKEQIADTPLADSKTDLLKMAYMEPAVGEGQRPWLVGHRLYGRYQGLRAPGSGTSADPWAERVRLTRWASTLIVVSRILT